MKGFHNRGRAVLRRELSAAQREAMEDLGFFVPAPPAAVGHALAPSDWSDPGRLRAAVEEQFRAAQRLRKKKAA